MTDNDNNKPYISFAILCKDEVLELDRLLKQLVDVDWDVKIELVILFDGEDSIGNKVFNNNDYIKTRILNNEDRNISYVLSSRDLDDFANQKNHLLSMCSGIWIYNLDADELLNEELLKSKGNGLVLFLDALERESIRYVSVPRINTVEGITGEHIEKWNWHVNEHGWINYPDYQNRIIYNNPLYLKWKGKVHETLIINKEKDSKDSIKIIKIPKDLTHFAIIHNKNIKKQEKQYKLYEEMTR